MKPDYKDDRPEAVIMWVGYVVISMLLFVIAWVAWSDDGFAGGVFFGIVICLYAWMTLKFLLALDRERARK
jgi:hypothetical protein